MISMALIAVDGTIIATAVPSIVHQLGGFSQFPWLFSIYLLSQAVTVPLYGKFSGVVGRKPILYLGIGIFLTGSVLCGIAWSMPILIAARALQGIGAGAVQPTILTIIGDLYSVDERSRVQGYMASVWAISSVIGPSLGGLFTQYLSWRWIFFVNLPIGAIAYWMLQLNFKEKVVRQKQSIDFLGALLLTSGCSLIILALLEGGVVWKWISSIGISILVLGIVFLVIFIYVESRVTDPIIPMWVLRHRVLLLSDIAAAGAGIIMIGLTAYIPTFAQGVLGAKPVSAGLALAALVLGWPVASTNSGKLYLKIGFRNTMFIGTAIVCLGTWTASRLDRSSSIWEVALACFIVGIGVGLSVTPGLVMVQSMSDWHRRGIVTSTNLFSRSLGSAIGAAIFGAIANASISGRLARLPSGLVLSSPVNVDSLNLALTRSNGDLKTKAFAQSAIFQATHDVLLTSTGVAVLILVAIWFLPAKVKALGT